MIGYLKGKFLKAEDSEILVDVSGVGYQVLVPARMVATLNPGDALEVFIHTNLRENALELFGFSNAWEKKVFLTLTTVSGVGPRTAISMLAQVEPETLLSAIVKDDKATLTKVPGVGKKTAERLILELQDKSRKLLAERGTGGGKDAIPPQGASAADMGSGVEALVGRGISAGDLWNQALDALVNLGYRESEAMAAIRHVSTAFEGKPEQVSLQTLLRGSLQFIAGKR